MYDCRPKYVRAGLGFGLGCTPAVSVTHSATAAAVCGLWRYVSANDLRFPNIHATYSLQRRYHVEYESATMT